MEGGGVGASVGRDLVELPAANALRNHVGVPVEQVAQRAALPFAKAAVEKVEADAALSPRRVWVVIEERVCVGGDLAECARPHPVRHCVRMVGVDVAIPAVGAVLAPAFVQVREADLALPGLLRLRSGVL